MRFPNTKLGPPPSSGTELSEFLAAYDLCAKANSPSVSHYSCDGRPQYRGHIAKIPLKMPVADSLPQVASQK